MLNTAIAGWQGVSEAYKLAKSEGLIFFCNRLRDLHWRMFDGCRWLRAVNVLSRFTAGISHKATHTEFHLCASASIRGLKLRLGEL